MRTFRLYGFTDLSVTVVTRGETIRQAMEYVTREGGAFRGSTTVLALNHLPMDAKILYDENHSPGWLHRAPVWLQRKERKEVADKGYAVVLAELETLLNQRKHTDE